jgi:hypothetical protein
MERHQAIALPLDAPISPESSLAWPQEAEAAAGARLPAAEAAAEVRSAAAPARRVVGPAYGSLHSEGTQN